LHAYLAVISKHTAMNSRFIRVRFATAVDPELLSPLIAESALPDSRSPPFSENPPLIELLIHNSSTDVSAIANGESTLMISIQQNRHRIVELLVQRPDLEVNALYTQDHPLCLMIELDDVKSCRVLLQHPVRLGKGHHQRNWPFPGGRFPISVSAKFAMPRPGEQTTRITKWLEVQMSAKNARMDSSLLLISSHCYLSEPTVLFILCLLYDTAATEFFFSEAQ
jgi:hypothetical protein